MYHETKRCRICGNNNLKTVLDLGQQYLTGVFPKTPHAEISKGPVQLVKCTGSDTRSYCGLVQMRHTFSPSEMYGATYGYRSGLNRGMIDHLHRKVDNLLQLVSLEEGDIVLDIGSNDGTSLSRFPQDDFTLIGIDPSAEKFRKFYRDDVELIVDFFSQALFQRRFGDRKAKIVTSIAMFYDLEDPQKFAKDVAGVLADEGVWHFEQSYLPAMLETNSYDTACHEHIEYYSLRQIEWILNSAELRIVDISRNNINGGSFAVTAAKVGSSYKANESAVFSMRKFEQEIQLDTEEPFVRFWQRILHERAHLLELLMSLRSAGKNVVGYGASTKGNVLLQFCGITTELLSCIVEVNEDKFGCFTPGTGIPIVSEAEARAMRPDYYLVLPWHFREGIVRREKDFIQDGGGIIFPLPTVEVVGGGIEL